MTAALLVLAGYLAGSIPTGYWVVRAARHVDIRTLGSGNIGASNVWRVFGWRLGLPVVLFDAAKGFAPAFAATHAVSHLTGAIAGAAAMVGHTRPVFLRWQLGGKMVATCGGAFFGVAPIVAAIVSAIWILTFVLSRYASLASIAAACSLPLAAALIGEPWPVIAFGGVSAVAVVFLHRANITRLRAGTESRFRLRRTASA